MAAQGEGKKLLQCSQLHQHGELWHASVSERQRSRPCGQNLRVPLEWYCHRKSKRALEQWWPTVRQKRSYLKHQGDFQHQLFTFRSVRDSDHGGVVRISVILIIYTAQFFPYQECNLIPDLKLAHSRIVIYILVECRTLGGEPE